jgi:hypothetical protein
MNVVSDVHENNVYKPAERVPAVALYCQLTITYH